MLSMEDVEAGSRITHRNTGLRYSVVDVGDEEVLLSAESAELQDLVVPIKLFRDEFVLSDRFSSGRSRRGHLTIVVVVAHVGGSRRPPAAKHQTHKQPQTDPHDGPPHKIPKPGSTASEDLEQVPSTATRPKP